MFILYMHSSHTSQLTHKKKKKKKKKIIKKNNS